MPKIAKELFWENGSQSMKLTAGWKMLADRLEYISNNFEHETKRAGKELADRTIKVVQRFITEGKVRPEQAYDPNRTEPTLLKGGDYVNSFTWEWIEAGQRSWAIHVHPNYNIHVDADRSERKSHWITNEALGEIHEKGEGGMKERPHWRTAIASEIRPIHKKMMIDAVNAVITNKKTFSWSEAKEQFGGE